MDHADRRFQFEVLDPMEALLTGLIQNVFVDPAYSRLHALTNAAATSLYHFAERRHGTRPWPFRSDEALRERVMDLADTAKHGKLRKLDRIVALTQGLSFTFTEQGKVRFDTAVVLASNGRHGDFDAAETLQAFMSILAREEGLAVEVERFPKDRPYQDAAISFVPPGDLPATSLRLLTKRVDADGIAKLADPLEMTFALFEGPPPEEHYIKLRTVRLLQP